MYEQDVCTLIDVNEQERKVKIRNYTDRVMFRAFGTVENPDYKDYQEFLESRCFPKNLAVITTLCYFNDERSIR